MRGVRQPSSVIIITLMLHMHLIITMLYNLTDSVVKYYTSKKYVYLSVLCILMVGPVCTDRFTVVLSVEKQWLQPVWAHQPT